MSDSSSVFELPEVNPNAVASGSSHRTPARIRYSLGNPASFSPRQSRTASSSNGLTPRKTSLSSSVSKHLGGKAHSAYQDFDEQSWLHSLTSNIHNALHGPPTTLAEEAASTSHVATTSTPGAKLPELKDWARQSRSSHLERVRASQLVDEAVQTDPTSEELKPAPGAAVSPEVQALNPDLAAKEMLFLSGMLDEGGQQQSALDVADLLKRANGDEDEVEREEPVPYSTQTVPSLGGFAPASSFFREGRSLEDILKERAAMGQQGAGDLLGPDAPEDNSEDEADVGDDLLEKPQARSLIQDITGAGDTEQLEGSDDGSEEDVEDEEDDDEDEDEDEDEDDEEDEEDEELGEEDASEAALEERSASRASSMVAPKGRATTNEPMQTDDVIEIGSSSDESEGQSDLEEEEEVLDLPEGDRLRNDESFEGLDSEEEELEEEELGDEEDEDEDDEEEAEEEEEEEEEEEAGSYDEDEGERKNNDEAFDETGQSGPTATADSEFLWGRDEQQSEVHDMVVNAPDAYQPQTAESSVLPSIAPDSRWSDFLYAENEDGDRPDVQFDESRDRAEERNGEGTDDLGDPVEHSHQATSQTSSSINVDPRLLAQAALAGGFQTSGPQHSDGADPSASSSLAPLLQNPDTALSSQQTAQAESVSFPPSHPSEALSFDQTMAIRAATGVLTGPGSSLGSVGGRSGEPSGSARKVAQGEDTNVGPLPNSAEELMDFKQESDRLAVEHTQGQIQSGPPSVGATEGSEGTVQRRTSFSVEGTPDRAHRGRVSAAHTPGPSGVPPLLDTPLASPSASSSSHPFFAPPLPRSGAALHLFKQSAPNRAAFSSAPASEGATADAEDVAQNQKGLPTMDEDLAAAAGGSQTLTSFDEQQVLKFDPTESSRSLVELKEATQAEPADTGKKGLSSLKSEPSATSQPQAAAASAEDGTQAIASNHAPEMHLEVTDPAQPGLEAGVTDSEDPTTKAIEAGTAEEPKAAEELSFDQVASTGALADEPRQPEQDFTEDVANVLALLGNAAATLPETAAEDTDLNDVIAVADDAQDGSDDDEVVDVDEHTEYEVESEGSVKSEPEEFIRESQQDEGDAEDEDEGEEEEEEPTYELGERTSYAVEEDGSVLMEPEEGEEPQEEVERTEGQPEVAGLAQETEVFQASNPDQDVLGLPEPTAAAVPTSAEATIPPRPVSILISSDESDQEEDNPAAGNATQTSASAASLGAVPESGPSKPRSPSPASTQFSPRRDRQSRAQQGPRPSTADTAPPASPASRQEKSLTALRKEWKMIKETEGASARPPAPEAQANELDDPFEVSEAIQEAQKAVEEPEEATSQRLKSEAASELPLTEEVPNSAVVALDEEKAPVRHRHRHRHGPDTENIAVDEESADESEDQPPITRSHCRFAKLTFTGQISGERVTFVVPECSIRHDHLKEEGADLLGAASKQDNNDKILFDSEEMEESTYHRLSRLVGHEMVSDAWVMPDSAWEAECEAAKTIESEKVGGAGERAKNFENLEDGSPVEASPEELRPAPSPPRQDTESDDELDVIAKHSSPQGKITPGRHRITPNKKHHRPEAGDRDWLPEHEDASIRSSKKRGASVTPSTSNKRAKAKKEEHPGFDADLSLDVLEGEAEPSQEDDIASQTPSKPARRRPAKRADNVAQSSDPPSQEMSTPSTRTRRQKASEASPAAEDGQSVAPARRNSSAGKRKSATPAPRDTSEAPSLASPRKTPSRRPKRTLQASAEEQDETMDLDQPAIEEADDGDVDMDAADAQESASPSTAVSRSTRAGSKRPARATRSSSRTLPEAGSSAPASQSSVTPRVTRAKARQTGKDAEEQ